MADQYLLIALVFIAAGIVKGTFGIGLPAVSLAVLTQFVTPHLAVTLVIFPIVVANLWQVFRTGMTRATVRRYGLLSVVLMISLFLTTYVTAQASTEVLVLVIGVAIVAFALTNLVRQPPPLPDRFDRPAQVVTGLASGVLGGLTSVWGPPVVSYLIARGIKQDEFVRATGLLFALGSLPLVLGFWQNGLLNAQTGAVSAAMVVPALMGFAIGEQIRARMSGEIFRKLLLWAFLLMGLNLLRTALF